MAYSLDGMTTLGTVTSEESTKESGLFQMPLPASDSSSAILIDLFGASRTINISGVHVTGEGGKTTAQFIAELDALISGIQAATKTFVSDKSSTSYEVMINSVTWSSEEGAVSKVNYTINMTEGSL